MAIGNIGPKRTPIKETEIAAAVKEGTSQTINWRLLEVSVSFFLKKIVIIIREQDLRNREEGINVDGVSGSDLRIGH
jgi:hypothetical protein